MQGERIKTHNPEEEGEEREKGIDVLTEDD